MHVTPLGNLSPRTWCCRAKGQQAPIAGITALAVCQRLMHFFRQHLLYETFDVLEPLWRSLDAVLDSGADLDQVSLVRASESDIWASRAFDLAWPMLAGRSLAPAMHNSCLAGQQDHLQHH